MTAVKWSHASLDRKWGLLNDLALSGKRTLRRNPEDDPDDIVHRYRGDPLGFITEGLGQCVGDSWRTWRIVLKAAYGKPLDDDELATFREVAQRDPPKHRVKELWLIVGRRGGKDSMASLIAAQAACYADEGLALRPGEQALVACFATDREQAKIVHGYTSAYFKMLPSLRRRVIPSAGVIRLTNNVEIRIVTNSFRAPRGYAIAMAIFDEVAFWRDENSATPDEETYAAVLGGASDNTMIVGISTPYKQSGLLYKKWKNHWGPKGDDDILVIKAPTTTFRPTFDRTIIARAMEEDPERARAEYLAEWRRDLADYVQREVIEAAVMNGVREIAPTHGVVYEAFVDPSGGQVDSFTLAIAHREGERGVLDCVREARPPFRPKDVVAEFAPLLRYFKCFTVRGDRYAGAWPANEFDEYGIQYEVSELSKGDIYREFLPYLNSGRTSLLDHPRMVNQFCGLDRRTVRGGRDSIDHRPNDHDDVANAVAGALVMVLGEPTVPIITAAHLAAARRLGQGRDF